MVGKLTSHMEQYLESIFLLEKEHGHAHVAKLAESLNIKMPSVTEAIRKLKKAKCVNYNKYSSITLTPRGRGIAEKVLRRHKVLFKFLHKVLGVNQTIADEEACKIEHIISGDTLKKLEKYVN